MPLPATAIHQNDIEKGAILVPKFMREKRSREDSTKTWAPTGRSYFRTRKSFDFSGEKWCVFSVVHSIDLNTLLLFVPLAFLWTRTARQKQEQLHCQLGHTKYTPTSVGLGGVVKGVDGALVEEEPEHSTDVTAARIVTGLLSGVKDALDQALGERLELVVGSRPLQDLQSLRSKRVQGQTN